MAEFYGDPSIYGLSGRDSAGRNLSLPPGYASFWGGYGLGGSPAQPSLPVGNPLLQLLQSPQLLSLLMQTLQPSGTRTPAPLNRTRLSPAAEKAFHAWYAKWAKTAGINPDPDDPRQQYDYRGAYLQGVEPSIDPSDGLYHWPSLFKDDDHPNRYVGGMDTKTGRPLSGTAQPLPRPGF